MIQTKTVDFYGIPIEVVIPSYYEIVTEGKTQENDFAINLPCEQWVNVTENCSGYIEYAGVGEDVKDFFCVVRRKKEETEEGILW